ncbi:hypothetical protein JD969_00045 [Planctomycetota bacterium]|nr:hypothetical protein JD969_00045 [Planctomycetota bacterium]
MPSSSSPPPSKPIFNIKAIRLTFILCLLFIALAIPATYLIAPYFAKNQYLSKITSQDASQRQLAYQYLIKYSPNQPDLLTTEPVIKLSDEQILELASTFNNASRWSKSTIPSPLYKRWIFAQLNSDEPSRQIIALEHLEEIATPKLTHQLIRNFIVLSRSKDTSVRYAVLITIARLYHLIPDADLDFYNGSLTNFAQDDDPIISRQAFIISALARNAPFDHSLAILFEDDPATVKEAAYWAILYKDQGNDPALHLNAVLADFRNPHFMPHTLYALASASNNPKAQQKLLQLASTSPAQITPENQIPVLRAILALPKPDFTIKQISQSSQFIAMHAEEPNDSALLEPLVAAATYRSGIAMIESRSYTDPFGLLVRLATIEGVHDQKLEGHMLWMVPEEAPDLLKIATQRVNSSPIPAAFLSALLSSDTPIRDLAVHIASQTLSDDQIKLLISKLLENDSSAAHTAIALLHALTNQADPDLIESFILNEQDYILSKTAEFARSMQDPHAPLSTDPEMLLISNYYPRSTLLMLLLHSNPAHQHAALEHMLLSNQFSNADIIELLDTKRFHYILYDILPKIFEDQDPADIPQLWLWADIGLQNLQLDILKQWYNINRHSLLELTATKTKQ